MQRLGRVDRDAIDPHGVAVGDDHVGRARAETARRVGERVAGHPGRRPPLDVLLELLDQRRVRMRRPGRDQVDERRAAGSDDQGKTERESARPSRNAWRPGRMPPLDGSAGQ